MKRNSTLFIISFVLISGLVLIPFAGVQGQMFRWQNYAGVYETPTPGPGGGSLLIDFTVGAPGSFFTVNGFGFIPDSIAAVRVNGVELGAVTISSVGDLELFLNTDLASIGRYNVTVEQPGVNAQTEFRLIPEGEQHPLSGSGTIIIIIPQGISLLEWFLPVIQR